MDIFMDIFTVYEPGFLFFAVFLSFRKFPGKIENMELPGTGD